MTTTTALSRLSAGRARRQAHARQLTVAKPSAARFAQIALGLIWLIDGALQFQPYMFGKTFVTGVLLPSAAGQPSVIGVPMTWMAHLIEPHVVLFNAVAATVQVLIGVGLLNRRTVKPALLVSFAWGMAVWVGGEGLGMIFTGTANPLTGAPGAALLYVIVGVMCWPRYAIGSTWPREAQLGLIGPRGARGAWALLWLGSAALWLMPANRTAGGAQGAIAAAPSGAGWLSHILSAAASVTAGHGVLIAVSAAVVSAAIGLAVLANWHPRPFLVLAIVISLVFWVVGQGLGGIFTGQATDVNAAPLAILFAAMLLAHAAMSARPDTGSAGGVRRGQWARARRTVPREHDRRALVRPGA
jgi:hypothetical protein